MANYTASCRSNYFRVKDAAAFEAWCANRHLRFWTKPHPSAGITYAITEDGGDSDGWPNLDRDTDENFDLLDELAPHLHTEDIAILLEAGAEKLRYIHATAKAVHPDGRTVCLSLHDIYDRAREEFGPAVSITEADY